MHFSPARWATAVTAAALIALPGSALAQSNQTQNPQSQPPSQSQPQQQPPQTQPSPTPQQPQQQPQQPPSTPPASTASPAPSGQADPVAAKQHLTEARNALSALTSMPEASKLQGEARTQVAQLITNFNAMITSQSDWRSSYSKVTDSLTGLLGPDSDQSAAAPSATGTTGGGNPPTPSAAAGAVEIDPAIRAKLVEFRTHLKEFEKSAGGATREPSEAASAGATPPAAAAAASNPANPASTATGTTGSEPSKPMATGTTGTEPSKPAATGMTGAEPSNPSAASAAEKTAGAPGPSAAPEKSAAAPNVNAAAQAELAAIDLILQKSKAGALTKEQTAELRQHVDALRAVLNQK